MPTVLKIHGLRVVIYPNDHRPAHVHVMGPDCEAMFNLHCPFGPPQLRENYGFGRGALNSIGEALTADVRVLCTRWREIHESD